MPISLRVATLPSHRALLGFGGVATVAALALSLLSSGDAPQPSICIQTLARPVAPVAPPAVTPPVAAPVPVAPAANLDPRAHELMFVFTANKASFIQIADLRGASDSPGSMASVADDVERRAIPRHGKLKLIEDDGVYAAIATVAPRDVPVDLLPWTGRKVLVDGHCEARITGFAVISRLTGDPSYADVPRWTAHTVMTAGQPVLAAKLDGCTGSYARDAALSNVVVPTELHDAALEHAARAALIASSVARDTQRAWDEQTTAIGAPAAAWYATDDAITTQVLRHPGTGQTFVSVHGQVRNGCGDPDANVWGLYRVINGALDPTPVQLRKLEELETIDTVLDVDGDGELELIGRSWVGNETMLTGADGTLLGHMTVPFYGCPC